MAQRKRFTRVEMARVLMERNQVSSVTTESLSDHFIHFPPSFSNAFQTFSTRNDSWNYKMQYDGLK